MKYTLEQRLDIGRRIYEGEINRFQAAQEYDINSNTARNYMWLYRDLPRKEEERNQLQKPNLHLSLKQNDQVLKNTNL